MRFFHLIIPLTFSSFIWLSAVPAHAQIYRVFGTPIYQPPVVYHYAPPVYYQPQVYYAPPVSYQTAYVPTYTVSRPVISSYSMTPATSGYSMGGYGTSSYSMGSAGASGYSMGGSGASGYSMGGSSTSGYSAGSPSMSGYTGGGASGYSMGSSGASGYSMGGYSTSGYSAGSPSMSGYSMGSSCISMPSYDGATTRRSYSAAKPETPGYSVAKPITRVEVGAYDNYFEPRTLTVNVGTTIRFQNHGHHAHTVTAKNHAFDSGDISPGADFLVRFKSAGTYHFYCRHHTKDKMEGTIIVESSASGSGDPNRSDSSRY